MAMKTGLAMFLFLYGCSPKRIILDQLGNTFNKAGLVYLTENDPQLVREAFPFNLKTIEVLLQEDPDNYTLLSSAASGFTMYAYAFIKEDADRTIAEDYTTGKALYKRATNLFNRARRYGIRGLQVKYPEIVTWMEQSAAAEYPIKKEDVPLLYWTAAAYGGAISTSGGDPVYLVDFPKVGWLLEQALKVDPDWNKGALYTAMISYSVKRPDAAPDADKIARDYFQKAVKASRGNDCSPYITFAEVVDVKNQNREEFIALLNQALAVDLDSDPELRLANVLAQSRATWLLGRVDELFY